MNSQEKRGNAYALFNYLNRVFKSVVLNLAIYTIDEPEESKMQTNGRKLGLYTVAGVAIAVIIIAAIFASGVQFPGSESQVKTGTLFVLLTDAPANLTNLNVTLDGIYVNNADSDTWTELNFIEGKSEVYFDLLALNNVTKDLSVAEIPAGNYTKIRLNVKAANATFADGHTADLTVPPEHIDVIIHFEIKEDATTILLIDMQADWVAVSHNNHLRPVLKASVVQGL